MGDDKVRRARFVGGVLGAEGLSAKGLFRGGVLGGEQDNRDGEDEGAKDLLERALYVRRTDIVVDEDQDGNVRQAWPYKATNESTRRVMFVDATRLVTWSVL